MAGVFISYRRDDSQGFAGRLADDLTEIIGSDLVFRDVEIPVGYDFTTVINRAVEACDVLLVVIGRNWQSPSAQGAKSRLFDPVDWVRAEIEAAFDKGKHVIPVLVGGAEMSSASDLPESIAHLSKIQAYAMSDRHWDDDIKSLAELLQNEVPALIKLSRGVRQSSEESPAKVLRELGNRVLDEVNRHRREIKQPEKEYSNLRRGPVVIIGRAVKKILTPIFFIAVVYVGLRLFGDNEVLQMLDRVEARLQIGWDRLLNYLNSLK